MIITSDALRDRAEDLAGRLLELILSRGNGHPRTYGFEYEFLPDRVLLPTDLSSLRELVLSAGCCRVGEVVHIGDLGVTFEPGGQIEYISPVFTASDDEAFRSTLDRISVTNSRISSELGIRYIGTGYIPGRYSAPLLLTADRYSRMHSRFMTVDKRGPDMMKGTAAIHLHAAMTSVDDLTLFYPLFCRLARGRKLGMSDERRAIWDATDRSRCGLPSVDLSGTAISMLTEICLASLKVEELSSSEPFMNLPDAGFEAFLAHLTTMFTDVRLNVKGGTLELRTLDSMPIESFPSIWKYFIDVCEHPGQMG